VLKKQGDRLYDGFTALIEEHLQDVNDTILANAYAELQAGVTQLTNATDAIEFQSSFLSKVMEAWTFHCVCTGMIADVLMYMV
jgi:hypothetical protein